MLQDPYSKSALFQQIYVRIVTASSKSRIIKPEWHSEISGGRWSYRELWFCQRESKGSIFMEQALSLAWLDHEEVFVWKELCHLFYFCLATQSPHHRPIA